METEIYIPFLLLYFKLHVNLSKACIKRKRFMSRTKRILSSVLVVPWQEVQCSKSSGGKVMF